MNKTIIALHYGDLLSSKEILNLLNVFENYDDVRENFNQDKKLLVDNQKRTIILDYIQKHTPDDIINKLIEENIYPVSIFDTDYPEILKETKNPPLVLYTMGNRALLKELSLAIVGTRKPTPYGRKVSREISVYLSDFLTIVSGLAIGIDSEAHQGALLGAKKTIAVLGSGFNHLYPAENSSLFNRIVNEGGLAISEYPPFIKPDSWRFPARNRIIAGISRATLVVEAGIKSGALITANYALEEGREVFAVPGLITSKHSQGSNMLLRDGAHLVLDYGDILEALNLFNSFNLSRTFVAQGNSEDLLCLLEGGPLSAEELSELSSQSIEKILSKLSFFELEGKVTRKSGLFYKK